MDKLLTSAFKSKKRTPVTTLFAQNGFRITMTDFDNVTFERGDIKLSAQFDMSSNLESVNIIAD